VANRTAGKSDSGFRISDLSSLVYYVEAAGTAARAFRQTNNTAKDRTSNSQGFRHGFPDIMKITIEIAEKDLALLRKEMRAIRKTVKRMDIEELVARAREALANLRGKHVPDFVSNRAAQLETLIDMTQDEDWSLPRLEREDVLAVLAYLSDPDDLIPDDVPGLGYLDDAIMVELLLRDLRHQREAYADFCEYREAYFKRHKIGRDLETRARRLKQRRSQLYQRMYRRIDNDRSSEKRLF